MAEQWVVVGCGYTGMYLVRALLGRGDAEITVTKRDAGAAFELGRQLGVTGVRADLDDPSTLGKLVRDGSIVVCLAPPGADPAREMRNLVAASQYAKRIVYVSSTGVYKRGGGDWVDESWPLEPVTNSGKARLAAEAALAEAAQIPWVSLRVAGIHGPGRKLIDRIRDGTYRVIGDGTTFVSRIHVVDLVAAIVAAGTKPVTGFINVADDDPSPMGIVADAIAKHLGLPPVPRVSPDSVSTEVAGMLTADRRIANQRLKAELGVELRFPSWRSML